MPLFHNLLQSINQIGMKQEHNIKTVFHIQYDTLYQFNTNAQVNRLN